ncbi:hypothetical protein K4K60_003994 [Colletotrichum sp. SAR11_57]|nr:hypothetical protein K4K60_003994 [Colletotrichum sp. SAR11_57]
MRAAQWRTTTGSIEKNLKLVTNAPLPKTASSLPKGCTLVKVAFASINHDYKLAELPLVNRIFPNPATPGVDYSGTVVATNLTTLKPGQRVFGRTQMHKCGTLAEYVVVGKSGIAPIPAGVSLKDAACVGICGVTALQALAPFVKEEDTVLINGGSGGTGMLFGGGKRRFKFHSVFANPEHSLRVARWIEEGKVKPVIEDVFGLEDADNAYARIKGGKAAGKMVIVVGGDSGTAK